MAVTRRKASGAAKTKAFLTVQRAYWVTEKELTLRYYIGEVILVTLYIHTPYDNLV